MNFYLTDYADYADVIIMDTQIFSVVKPNTVIRGKKVSSVFQQKNLTQ